MPTLRNSCLHFKSKNNKMFSRRQMEWRDTIPNGDVIYIYNFKFCSGWSEGKSFHFLSSEGWRVEAEVSCWNPFGLITRASCNINPGLRVECPRVSNIKVNTRQESTGPHSRQYKITPGTSIYEKCLGSWPGLPSFISMWHFEWRAGPGGPGGAVRWRPPASHHLMSGLSSPLLSYQRQCWWWELKRPRLDVYNNMRDTRSPTGRGEYCLRRPNVSLFRKMAKNMNGKILILEFGEIFFSLAPIGNKIRTLFSEQFVFLFLFLLK